MKPTTKTHLIYLAVFFVGVIGYWAASTGMGEAFSVAVGPEFLVRIPIGLVKVALALWLTRWIVRDRFPTLWAWCRKGDKPESEFTRHWNAVFNGAHDIRLPTAVGAHVGVLIAVAILIDLVW